MKIRLKSGSEAESIAIFNNGNSHIIVDDGCYVIVNRDAPNDIYGMSSWIFPEALEMLKTLPPPSGY